MELKPFKRMDSIWVFTVHNPHHLVFALIKEISTNHLAVLQRFTQCRDISDTSLLKTKL